MSPWKSLSSPYNPHKGYWHFRRNRDRNKVFRSKKKKKSLGVWNDVYNSHSKVPLMEFLFKKMGGFSTDKIGLGSFLERPPPWMRLYDWCFLKLVRMIFFLRLRTNADENLIFVLKGVEGATIYSRLEHTSRFAKFYIFSKWSDWEN